VLSVPEGFDESGEWIWGLVSQGEHASSLRTPPAVREFHRPHLCSIRSKHPCIRGGALEIRPVNEELNDQIAARWNQTETT
jgi:hypothetical protein